MASAKANKKAAAMAVELPECPVCMETMSKPIFQCQSGHSLCNTCTSNLCPPTCPICRQPMTQMRNWQLEDIIAKAKVPCPNKDAGCVYTMFVGDVDDHLKECIFRQMDCPFGVTFGKCTWTGKVFNMMDHFKERHPTNCNVDTLQKMAYWAIQHVGGKKVAQQHIYEIHVTSKLDSRRKVVFIEHCFNDAIKADEVFRQAKCGVLPLNSLNHFIKDKKLSFRFFVKRIPPAQPKNKNEKDEVDLRSDTVTKPCEYMKSAMIRAEVGDDVFGEDPTVNKLEQKVATTLGKEAALFVASGTMANLIAAMVHCSKRGSEMLCGDLSHVYCREGGISHLAGVLVTSVKNLPDGTFNIDELQKKIRGSDIHEPVTMMVAVENTHSFCGGKVLPLAWLEQLSAVTKAYGLSLHMDGARLFNAAEYLRVDPARVARDCDSVSVCFSKGLGAPVGSALAGTKKFIQQARRCRKMLGGGMRQAGVLAAFALVALDRSVGLLGADHQRAQYLAKAIQDLKQSSFTIDLDSQHTNIVHVNISDKTSITSDKIKQRLSLVDDCKTSDGYDIVVLSSAKLNPKTLKFVLHRDINDEDLKYAVKKIGYVLQEFERNK
ncbi:beta-eliminating lyase domain-containing protein [Phthorimaea operculella]|nr:beta-eliminating lyase domain-containing protein [Phthorimaea operculella]